MVFLWYLSTVCFSLCRVSGLNVGLMRILQAVLHSKYKVIVCCCSDLVVRLDGGLRAVLVLRL